MEEIGSSRAEYTRRSHSSDNIDTTKSKCIRNDGNTKREDSNQDIQELCRIEKETILGKSFLGTGIFCQHSGIERGNDKAICKISRRRREERGRKLN